MAATQILPYIYLGDIHATNESMLQEYGIVRIVPCYAISEFIKECYTKTGINYKIVSIETTSSILLKPYLVEDVFPWIREAEEQRISLLVHCEAGESRSPAFIIAYLMWRNHLTFQDAYSFIVAHHPPTNPSPYVLRRFLECIGCPVPDNYFRIWEQRCEERKAKRQEA